MTVGHSFWLLVVIGCCHDGGFWGIDGKEMVDDTVNVRHQASELDDERSVSFTGLKLSSKLVGKLAKKREYIPPFESHIRKG